MRRPLHAIHLQPLCINCAKYETSLPEIAEIVCATRYTDGISVVLISTFLGSETFNVSYTPLTISVPMCTSCINNVIRILNKSSINRSQGHIDDPKPS